MSSKVYILVSPTDIRSELEKYLHQHKIEFIKKAGEDIYTYTVTIPYQRATAISKKFITVTAMQPTDESYVDLIGTINDGSTAEPDSPDMARWKDAIERAKHFLNDKWWVAVIVVAGIFFFI